MFNQNPEVELEGRLTWPSIIH